MAEEHTGARPDDDPDPADGDAEPRVPLDEERRYPSTIGGACYLVILGVVVVGLALAASGPWRIGVQVVAGALIAASVLRLALRQRDAGMLAVRHRLVDALLLAGSAGVLIFLAQTIPNQPG